VINLPSEDLVTHVDRLALTTGKSPVPEKKRKWAICYEPDKFGMATFTPVGDRSPHRACASIRYKMEGVVQDFRPFGKNVSVNVFELHIL
jgi:flavin reductase (DIM6/NTAB) family NADH-FMN oxidoreductase RutF